VVTHGGKMAHPDNDGGSKDGLYEDFAVYRLRIVV